METIIYDYSVKQSREVVAVVDYQKLSQDADRDMDRVKQALKRIADFKAEASRHTES